MRIRQKTKRAKNITGTAQCPRLAVYRSLTNIYAQLIDDEAGKTIVSENSLKLSKAKPMELATQVGQKIAEKAKAAGVTQVVFDRRRRLYHGRIKALADAARSAGLKF